MASLGVVHTPADRPPTDVADLLAGLLREPGRPRLTWYGPDGERIELSGAVLVNWVNKTTNLLVEEFDAGPGTRVLLDLPGHWRAAVWALATWRAGATAVVPDGDPATTAPDPGADVVVTARPHAWPAAPDIVAVALGALARRVDGPLPANAIDGASEVMTQPDTLGPTAPTDPGRAALVTGRTVLHRDLLEAPERPPHGARLALVATTAAQVALDCLGAWAVDGSVVLLDRPLQPDDPALARLLDAEQVTAGRP